eukprot:g39596.t1
MGVGGFEIDVGVEAVTRDGDGEVQEGEGGIGDGPGEFEVGVKGVSKVDELFKLFVGARGSANAVIDVAEEEVVFINMINGLSGHDSALPGDEMAYIFFYLSAITYCKACF